MPIAPTAGWRSPEAAMGMGPAEHPPPPAPEVQAALLTLGRLLFGQTFLQPASVDERLSNLIDAYAQGVPLPMAGGLLGIGQAYGPEAAQTWRAIQRWEGGKGPPSPVGKLHAELKDRLAALTYMPDLPPTTSYEQAIEQAKGGIERPGWSAFPRGATPMSMTELEAVLPILARLPQSYQQALARHSAVRDIVPPFTDIDPRNPMLSSLYKYLLRLLRPEIPQP